MTLRIILCIVIGYALGNLNGAILISRLLHREDVREKGSGNAGLTNFFRNYGGPDTLLVLLIDAGKGVLACFVGKWLFQNYCPEFVHTAQMLAGGFAVIGHVFPVMWSLRGGKGIMTCTGIALFYGIAYGIWWILLICLGLFVIAVAITKWVSLGSICIVLSLVAGFLIFLPEEHGAQIIAAVLAALAIFMHRGNIVRILHGTERKLSFKKKKETET